MCDCFPFLFPLKIPTTLEYYVCVDACKACTRLHLAIDMRRKPQEVGGTLIGEDGSVVIAGVEWYQIHQRHGFHVFDAIPFATFHPLL